MLTDTQISNLAAAAHSLRPDWPLKSLTTFIANNLQARAYRDVAVALAWVGADEKTQTPKRVLSAGPWWKSGGEESTWVRPPRKDESCPLHPGNYATACHGCRADQLAGDRTLPPELRRPDASNHAQRARAEVRAATARCCSHGIDRARGKCTQCERETTTPTETEEIQP